MTIGEVWDNVFIHPEDGELGDSKIGDCLILSPVGLECLRAVAQVKDLLAAMDPHPCVRRHFLNGLRAQLGVLYHG